MKTIVSTISQHHTFASRKSLKIISLLIIFSLGFISTLQAQLERVPVQRKNPSAISKSKKESARIKAVSLSLPFWDDFSFTPVNDTSNIESNAPLSSLWARGQRVWINDGMGINAPTINVATFDGLDSLGLPYSIEVLATGFRDTLESQPINLEEVIGADTNTVFLSFFYQWQGNGEAPDATDYMRLEFKDSTGAWANMMTINTKSSLDKTVFYDTIIQVKGKKFFHENFQFRLQNFGRKSGPFDTWNIDYVYLNKGRTINDNSFPDQALTSTITPLFGKYSAMPKKHFFASPVIDSVKFNLNNLLNRNISVDYYAIATFINYKNSIATPFTDTLVNSDGIRKSGGLMFPFERVQVQFKVLPNPANILHFNPDADRIDITLKAIISPDNPDPNDFIPFTPITFTSNDTVSTYFHLNDYYAYDDGTAEYSARLAQPGNRFAYQFTRPANIPDSLAALNGFDIYFPDFGVVNNPEVQFFVYDDDGGMPGDILYSRFYQIQKNGINKFQKVPIGGEPFSVGTTYYIGWNQPLEGNVLVGLDASNNTGDKMRVYTNGTWEENDRVEGSIMLRPHFGEADIITAVPKQEQSVQVFPNPSKGEFYIRGKYDKLEIISLTGQPVSFTSTAANDDMRITLSNPTSGLYILKIIKGKTLQTKKIVID